MNEFWEHRYDTLPNGYRTGRGYRAGPAVCAGSESDARGFAVGFTLGAFVRISGTPVAMDTPIAADTASQGDITSAVDDVAL